MIRRVAWDTWAFVETYLHGPRSEEVQALGREVDVVYTSREVVAETFNFLVKRTDATREAWSWWAGIRQGRARVVQRDFEEVTGFVEEHRDEGALSFTDLSLAQIALEEGVDEVATEDDEFRRLGLVPLFSRR